MNRRNLLIISALKDELEPIRNGINILHYNNLNIDYFISGIGKEKSEIRISERLNKSKVEFILNIGTAGSLTDDLRIGEVISPSKFCAYINDDLIEIDVNTILSNTLKNGKNCKIFTSLKPVINKTEKDKIKQNTESNIVDMEAFWIARICKNNQINYSSIKVISDYAESITVSEFKLQLKKNAELLVGPVKSFLEVYNKQ